MGSDGRPVDHARSDASGGALLAMLGDEGLDELSDLLLLTARELGGGGEDLLKTALYRRPLTSRWMGT